MINCLFCNTNLVKRIGSDGRAERPSQFKVRKFCNVICRGQHKTSMLIIKKNCPICFKQFCRPNSYNQKTCSKICSSKATASLEILKICVYCNKKFNVKSWHNKNAPSKYCTSKCYWESLKGPLSILWKGGRALASTTCSNKRRALKMGSGGYHTSIDWQNLKQKYDFVCLCCREQEPNIKLTRDHVIPLVHGGTNDISNIQPLCAGCNSKKHKKSTDYRTLVINVV